MKVWSILSRWLPTLNLKKFSGRKSLMQEVNLIINYIYNHSSLGQNKLFSKSKTGKLVEPFYVRL